MRKEQLISKMIKMRYLREKNEKKSSFYCFVLFLLYFCNCYHAKADKMKLNGFTYNFSFYFYFSK